MTEENKKRMVVMTIGVGRVCGRYVGSGNLLTEFWQRRRKSKPIIAIHEEGNPGVTSKKKGEIKSTVGRLRWINYLRPDLKRGAFSVQEERLIIDLRRILGNRWAQIAKHLPGRTDNEVKSFWNSCIKKELMAQGIDLKTHKLLNEAASSEELQEEKSAWLIDRGFAGSETRDGLKMDVDIREIVPANYMDSLICAGNVENQPYFAIHGGTWIEGPSLYADYIRPDHEK